ncbi:MAG: hypothetical protein HC900_03770 [Methylacidiphilales bacterium]|nr:hypothetical protein [Candidatus Methylacidiphilales bacterium]
MFGFDFPVRPRIRKSEINVETAEGFRRSRQIFTGWTKAKIADAQNLASNAAIVVH